MDYGNGLERFMAHGGDGRVRADGSEFNSLDDEEGAACEFAFGEMLKNELMRAGYFIEASKIVPDGRVFSQGGDGGPDYSPFGVSVNPKHIGFWNRQTRLPRIEVETCWHSPKNGNHRLIGNHRAPPAELYVAIQGSIATGYFALGWVFHRDAVAGEFSIHGVLRKDKWALLCRDLNPMGEFISVLARGNHA